MVITVLNPTRATPKKFMVNNKYIVCFTVHAVERCIQRGLCFTEVLQSLSGVPMRLWRALGVFAKKNGRYIKIITCYRVKTNNIKPLW